MPERTPSPQETLWAGDFGTEYIQRNKDSRTIACRAALFATILGRTRDVRSVLELGANIGLNLVAIRQLLPEAAFTAVEINDVAAGVLRDYGWVDVKHGSLLASPDLPEVDFAFTSGVLIHIQPDDLPQAYETLHRASRKYICVSEYYNPTPVSVEYRGHEGTLFKRDFAGDLLDRYQDLRLVDYGFVYRRDPMFPLDDTSWFLLEKK